MSEAPAWITIFNPVNGLPWECPNNPESLAYYIDEKKFTKKPNAKTPATEKETANG